MNEELDWSGLHIETNTEYVPEHLAEILASYSKVYQLDEKSFVRGKGRHKTVQQRQYEQLQTYLNKLEEYREKLTICGERRNSYSKTDHSATFMRLKTDYIVFILISINPRLSGLFLLKSGRLFLSVFPRKYRKTRFPRAMI